ncbi:DUF397 domain-containing protein [Streptomyces sp. NBC_01288]|uniref:DUF397 domain-containing protein n=1 Tax=Streptomyces sp. NBC_01288 TaxID=2903814 RepID=UPI002E12FB88|nr:DUF397 domain-containing protein [Streptomyces sp. NBC_01288]
MIVEKPSDLMWFKSSYSSGAGGECLEVALAWRKSSYSSGEGGQCVEIATCPTTIHVRDSKHLPEHDGPVLALAPGTWQAFLGLVSRA